eukprot:g47836.t1
MEQVPPQFGLFRWASYLSTQTSVYHWANSISPKKINPHRILVVFKLAPLKVQRKQKKEKESRLANCHDATAQSAAACLGLDNAPPGSWAWFLESDFRGAAPGEAGHSRLLHSDRAERAACRIYIHR